MIDNDALYRFWMMTQRASAVIPALIAYIKVVAVKKLVVGCRARAGTIARGRGIKGDKSIIVTFQKNFQL
jgi:hypothetical protein